LNRTMYIENVHNFYVLENAYKKCLQENVYYCPTIVCETNSNLFTYSEQ
jgi:hypothetical protein